MTNRYSTIFDSKIPSFIKDDPSYSKFINFFTAYYEWFDDTYNIMGFGDKIDIDAGFGEFTEYFKQDFLPYFPDDIAADKIKLIKIAKELYKAKGIPDSFKFLFRALYNVHADVYTTREYVLRASDGKWIVPKSIKIKSLDTNFLNIDNFKVFGELSKTIGIIEKSKINGKFIQIYLSNIERLYYSGEPIKILDSNNKDVYFLNGEQIEYTNVTDLPAGSELLSSKIIGSLSSIDIVSNKRGQLYKVGNPVVITAGVNPDTSNPVKAVATVSEVTQGQIQNIVITSGGYGYRKDANSSVDVIYNNKIDPIANCSVALLNEYQPMNVAFISDDLIGNNWLTSIGATNYNFTNTANANTTLSNSLSLINFITYPIVDVLVTNGGGGYESNPSIDVKSLFRSSDTRQNLADLGILAPIQIFNSGANYTTNDTLTVVGGDGDFAYARITAVNGTGGITKVEYYQDPQHPYSIGGMGYKLSNLPTIEISTSTGNGLASLIVPGILGSGVDYTLETDRIGAITKISLSENGEDYISTPNVSLRVQDIAVTDMFGLDITDTIIYQGEVETPTFFGYVDSVTLIDAGNPSTLSDDIFSLRLYDYRGVISDNPLKLYNITSKTLVGTPILQKTYTNSLFTKGIQIYGDGSAKAKAKFLNGIILDSGRYLNSDGQLSAHSVLQNDVYNSTTYILSAEKDYDSYKNVVTNLLHPSGTRIVTRNLIKSSKKYTVNTNSSVHKSNNALNLGLSLIKNSTKYSNTFNFYYVNDTLWNDNGWGDDTWGNSVFDTNIPTNIIGSKINISTNNHMNVYSTVTNARYTYHNLLPYSEQFDNVAWGKSNTNIVSNMWLYSEDLSNPAWITTGSNQGTLSINSNTAPDGTLTADMWTYGSSTSTTPGQNAILIDNQPYTISFHIHSDSTVRFIRIRVTTAASNLSAFYNTSTKAFTTLNSGFSNPIVTPLNNGWYRVSVVYQPGTGDGGYRNISLAGTLTSGTTTANPGNTAILWGTQLNLGTTTEPYTKTTSNTIPVLYSNQINSNTAFKLIGANNNSAHYIYETTIDTTTKQNLILYSEQFDNSIWFKGSSLTVTSNTTTAPDGTVTADTITVAGTAQGLYQTIAVTPNSTYTVSAFVKLGTMLASEYKMAIYNATTSAFIATDITPTQSSIVSADYWTRVSYTLTIPSGCTSIRYYPFRNAAAISTTVYLWGAQVEQRSVIGNYTQSTSIAINGNSTYNYITPIVSGTTYTASIYAKKGERNYFQLACSNTAFGDGAWVNYNLNAGNVASIGANSTSAQITSVGNGWYRCNFSTTAISSINDGGIIVALLSSDTPSRLPVYQGTGNSGIYIYGAQLNIGQVQPYIKTIANNYIEGNTVDTILTVEDNIQYDFPAIYKGYTNANSIIIVTNNYPGTKYYGNAFPSIGDTITLGLNANTIINISNNVLYFNDTLNPTGNSSNLISMSLNKNLTSNNVLIYTTV
jgi:hypothetical protein